MTRFKKALRSHGVKLEVDFPYIPYYDGNVTIEGRSVIFKHNLIIVTSYYDEVGIVTSIFDRNFSAVPVLEDGSEEIKQYLNKHTHLVIHDDMEKLRLLFNNEELMCVIRTR